MGEEKTREVKVKGIPEGVTDEELFRWVGRLVDRHYRLQARPSQKVLEEIEKKSKDFIKKNTK